MSKVSSITPGGVTTLDRQPRSKKLREVDDPQLPLVEQRDPVDVPIELILKQKTFAAAIALCVQVAGLEDKEVFLPLGIDPGHWTRILKGEAHFPVNKLVSLFDLCGNEAPLVWLAHRRGYELKPLLGKLEKEIEKKDQVIDSLTDEVRVLRSLIVGRSVA